MPRMSKCVSLDVETVLEALRLKINVSRACNEGLKKAVENEKNIGVEGQTTPVSSQTPKKLKEYPNDK